MKTLLFLSVIILFTINFCKAGDVKQIAHFGNKVLYAIQVLENVSASEAKTLCKIHGYALAALESRGENSAVGNYLQERALNGEHVVNGWLGASDAKREGMWYWIYSRRKVGPFQSWAVGEPITDDEYNCMYMSPPGKGRNNNGKWTSYFCNEPHGLPICQKIVDPRNRFTFRH